MAADHTPTPSRIVRDEIDYQHRTTVNLIAAVALLVLMIGLAWTFLAFDERRKLERCLNSGRRDCLQLTSTPAAAPQRAH